MLLYDRLEKTDFSQPTAVCLGFFDGVHLGHQAVLNAAVRQDGLLPAVFSFAEHPQDVLTGKAVLKITDLPRKIELFERFRIQAAAIVPFAQVREMPPEEFVTMLRERMNARVVCMGSDFRFGRERSGDAETMRRLCQACEMTCIVVPPVEHGGRKVSSTAIRLDIATGRMLQATEMLGHSFTLRAPVLHGQQLGRLLGFPTINQPLPDELVPPKHGVYLSYAIFDGLAHPSVTNVGIRPTVHPGQPVCETHIFNYSGELYGTSPQLALTNFLRPERQFADLNALQAAVRQDMLTALAMHKALQDGGITTLC